MHYRDGTEAKMLDLVAAPQSGCPFEQAQQFNIGIVTGLSPGADTCNGSLRVLARQVKGPDGMKYLFTSQDFYDQAFSCKDAVPLRIVDPLPAAVAPPPEAPKPAA